MKEKALELQRCFVPHLGGLSMIFSYSSSILLELSKDLKNTGFHLCSSKQVILKILQYSQENTRI